MDTIELTEAQINSIRDIFKSYDVKGDGHIGTEMLGDIMRSFGHRLRSDQLRELIELVDVDVSGTIEWEEFLPLMAAKLKEKEDYDFYKNLFRVLDKKRSGHVTCHDLKRILKGMADEVKLTENEIDEMIDALDENGDGLMSFEEFLKLMTSK